MNFTVIEWLSICLTAYHTGRYVSEKNNKFLTTGIFFFVKNKYPRKCRYINLAKWTLTFKLAHPMWQTTVDISQIIRVFPGYVLIYTCIMLIITCAYERLNIKPRILYNGVAYHVEITWSTSVYLLSPRFEKKFHVRIWYTVKHLKNVYCIRFFMIKRIYLSKVY